ncbi:MAG TPA: hypothetical protein VK939_12770 [Longimicrobiales bacterium]|nr:hypothetical protein [Longimicrobiales bacterium]
MMRLGLSSAAARDAGLGELIAACVRRGLAVLELRAGDGHGVELEDALSGVLAAEQARAVGVEIAVYRASAEEDTLRLARLGEALGATLLLDGAGDVTHRALRARRLVEAGVDAAVVVRGAGARHDARVVTSLGLAVAWDAAPGERPLADDADALLGARGARLRHICLRGGGPEAVLHEGRGVGALMGRLALAGYAGSLTLAPGSRRYEVAWQIWLGRRGGWGCGGKAHDRTLVNLAGT